MHGWHQQLPSLAKPGRQSQKPVSGETADCQPSSEQVQSCWLESQAVEVTPEGHGTQLARLIVNV